MPFPINCAIVYFEPPIEIHFEYKSIATDEQISATDVSENIKVKLTRNWFGVEDVSASTVIQRFQNWCPTENRSRGLGLVARAAESTKLTPLEAEFDTPNENNHFKLNLICKRTT